MMRICAVALSLCGCGRTPDPIVGRWKFDAKVIELRDDGTIIAAPRSEPACESERDAVSVCANKHRWENQGSRYRVTMMTLAQPRTAGMDAMFDKSAGSRCRCVEDVVGTAVLDGDELVLEGRERGTRVRR